MSKSPDQVIDDIIKLIEDMPHFIQEPDTVIPTYEEYDEYGLPTGYTVPSRVDSSKRLSTRQDIVDAINSYRKTL
jgi:hypothetical protein